MGSTSFVQSPVEFAVKTVVDVLPLLFPSECSSKGPEICRETFLATESASVQSQNFTITFALQEVFPDRGVLKNRGVQGGVCTSFRTPPVVQKIPTKFSRVSLRESLFCLGFDDVDKPSEPDSRGQTMNPCAA